MSHDRPMSKGKRHAGRPGKSGFAGCKIDHDCWSGIKHILPDLVETICTLKHPSLLKLASTNGKQVRSRG
jgi:hypothetical protein